MGKSVTQIQLSATSPSLIFFVSEGVFYIVDVEKRTQNNSLEVIYKLKIAT